MLTNEDVQVLARPFALNDHEFREQMQRGKALAFAYVAEGRVGQRLNEVDPAWAWRIVELRQRDRQMVVHGVLTVKGIERAGVGMAYIEVGDKDSGREYNEADKSAATDAFRRAARMFGVGVYLLDAPTDKNEFSRWLAGLSGAKPASEPAPARATGGTAYPTVKPWEPAQAAYLMKQKMAAGLSQTDIYRALGIRERLGEWQGSAAEANERIEAYIAAGVGA